MREEREERRRRMRKREEKEEEEEGGQKRNNLSLRVIILFVISLSLFSRFYFPFSGCFSCTPILFASFLFFLFTSSTSRFLPHSSILPFPYSVPPFLTSISFSLLASTIQPLHIPSLLPSFPPSLLPSLHHYRLSPLRPS